MIRSLNTVLLLILTAFSLFAQPAQLNIVKGKISGTVFEANSGTPLGYATVSLYNSTDNTLITGTITDDRGAFELEAREGSYYITLDFISFQTVTINDIQISRDKSNHNLGSINMEPEAKMLEEIVVQAEKSSIQMQLDKKVFNVGKDLGNAGGSVIEILDNIPSVSVDVDGNVSLRGSGNVRILIDGKPSGLVSFSGSAGLRQLPAGMIDRVEVITNPSARYEAEGMSGIINIILKKERKNGLNGAVDINVGLPDNYGASVNMNLRQNNLNLFANYGISYDQHPGSNTLYQEFYKGDTTFITDQINHRTRGGLSNNLRLGAEYNVNPKNLLTTSFSYRIGNNENNSNIVYKDYINNLNNIRNITTRGEVELEDRKNYEYQLTYKRLFGRQGHELTADFQIENSNESENSDLTEKFFTAEYVPTGAPSLLQRSITEEGEKQTLFTLDYVLPFAKDGKFEAGFRGSLRDIENDYLVEEFDDAKWNNLTGLSNNLFYGEDIFAGYFILGNKVKKFSYQLGLRAEHSTVITDLQQTNEINKRNYTNLFPSAHLTYELLNQNNVQVSYSRRLRRPRMWDLNPFFSFSDNRNYWSGNPNLDPEFTNSFELSHIKYWEKSSLSSSIYYRHTDGKIERIKTIDNNGNTLTRPENLSTEDAYGLEFTGSVTPYKWWKIDGSFNFYRAITDGSNLDVSFASDSYSWFSRLTSRFSPTKQTDIQLRGHYHSPRTTAQGKSKANYSFDLAMSQDILKGNATLTLNARDLLNTRRHRSITEGESFYSVSNHQWRGRQINLTFNYRLNQKKQRSRPERREFEGEGMEY